MLRFEQGEDVRWEIAVSIAGQSAERSTTSHIGKEGAQTHPVSSCGMVGQDMKMTQGAIK